MVTSLLIKKRGNNMQTTSIAFAHNISIIILNVETKELTREIVNKDHWIFKEIQAPFDYYQHNAIVIIPSPKISARKNWEKNIFLCNQELDCSGKFIAFFHLEKFVDHIILANSLTQEEHDHIENGIRFC